MVPNSVRSGLEWVRQRFKRGTVGRRATSAFPSVFDRFWRTIPAYLPFYMLAALVLYAFWYGRQPAIVIAPFHLPPASRDKPLPFSGDTAAGLLQDAITAIRQEAAGKPVPSPCERWAAKDEEYGGLKAPPSVTFQVRGPVLVEVKGVSVESIVSFARE